jgi:ligand-binding sensor domain-containing protein
VAVGLLVVGALAASIAAAQPAEPAAAPADLPLYGNWKTYLPGEKVMAVLIDGPTIWAGTDEGLVEIRDDKIVRRYTVEDGLPFRVVSTLSKSERTKDLWVGTFGGLARLSGGKFTSFTQLNSGLSNDVIYTVHTVDDEVWAATAAGICVYDPNNNNWGLYDQTNTLMKEPWCYAIASTPTHVYAAIWGSGMLEFDRHDKHWKAYNDPDGEFEVDVLKDDGLLHDIVTSIGTTNGIIWVGSYFGLSRYDDRHWQTYIDKDSALPSNFIQNLRAVDGFAFCCTDNGLAAFDGKTWVVYQGNGQSEGEITIKPQGEGTPRTVKTQGSIAHSFVFDASVTRDRLAVATSKGVSIGQRLPESVLAEPIAAAGR